MTSEPVHMVRLRKSELFSHIAEFSCHLGHDQEHGAAATLTKIFFQVGKRGMMIPLFNFPKFTTRLISGIISALLSFDWGYYVTAKHFRNAVQAACAI